MVAFLCIELPGRKIAIMEIAKREASIFCHFTNMRLKLKKKSVLLHIEAMFVCLKYSIVLTLVPYEIKCTLVIVVPCSKLLRNIILINITYNNSCEILLIFE